MWNTIGSFCLRNRFWLLVALSILTIFFGYFATKVQMTYDFAKVVPKDDPDFIDYVKFKQTFGEDGNILVIGTQNKEIFKLNYFNNLYDLCNEIEQIEGVEKVVSITKAYYLNRNDSIGKLQMLPILSHKPKTQHELDSIQIFVKSLKFYSGLLYNPESDLVILAITLKKEQLDSKARIPLVKGIEAKAREFGLNNNSDMHFSGLPYVRTMMSSKVADEIKIFTYLSILITALFIFIFFRFISAVIFSMIIVIIGVVATMGLLALFDYKITILTGILPPLMVIIGVQNCIYLLNVYHQEFNRHGNKMLAILRLISKNGMALFLTNTTTAVGFVVFSFSGSAMLDQFSIVSGLVIMLIYVISLVFIPIAYSYLPPPKPKHTKHLENKRLNGVLNQCYYLIHKRRSVIYAVTVILLAFSIYGATKVRNLGYVVDDLPADDPVYMDLKFFEKHLKGALPFEIKIDTKRQDGVKDYATLQKISRLQKELVQFPELSKATSVVDILKFANQGMNQGQEKYYILPSVVDISEIVEYLPKEGKNSNIVRSMVDSIYQVARVSVQMADIGSVEMKRLTKAVQNKIDSIFPKENYTVKITGTSAIFLKGNDYLIKNLMQSMIAALIIISMMMAFLFFSWRMVIISLIPNLIPLIMTFGIMGYFDIRLKPSTIIIFSIAYGIVVDFTIHYLAKYRHALKKHNWDMKLAIPESLLEAGPSIIYTAIALFAGFIIFGFSSFGGTVALGVLTSISLVFGTLMNLLLLPAMLLTLEKSMNTKKELGTSLVEIEPEDIDE
ncbi:MAG: efflux RND transporter permease subunit [bacterium]|nr:efflux RND transporter permease subunit [bacterium]